MDDLFGFDESTENDELANPTAAAKENTINQQDQNIKQTSANPATSSITATVLHQEDLNQMRVVSLPIPKFQQLAQISGDLIAIEKTIQSLSQTESIWLEIIYTGDDIVSDLREHIQAMVDGLPFEVLKIKNTRTYNKVLNQQQNSETLQDLDEMDVFERCLTINDVPDSQKDSLRDAYGQILYNLHHDDSRAE